MDVLPVRLRRLGRRGQGQAAEHVAVQTEERPCRVDDRFLVAGIVDPVHQVGEVRGVLLVEGAVRAEIA